MRVRQLESALSANVDETFATPKQRLEQYPTNAALAAGVLHGARARGDVEGKFVVDLGCGTGILSVAATLCDAAVVVGVDVDEDALTRCAENLRAFEPALEVELVCGDVIDGSWTLSGRRMGRGGKRCDTVLMNPPFGAWRGGADVAFLRAAFKIADGAIYSLHKTSTRAHIEKVAKTRFHAREAEVLAQLKYDLPATYGHHREKSVEIAVDLWRFEPTPGAVIDDEALELELAHDASIDGLARDLSSKAHVRGGRGGGRRGGGRRGARGGRGK